MVSAEGSWLDFNINETVRVKLTEAGLTELKRQHDELNRQLRIEHPWAAPTLDADGFYVSQLWCLMQDFGHMMANGVPVPFETWIQLRASAGPRNIQRMVAPPFAGASASATDAVEAARAAISGSATVVVSQAGANSAVLGSTDPVSEKIERLARILCQCDEQDGAAPWDWYDRKGQDRYRERARACIAEMESSEESGAEKGATS